MARAPVVRRDRIDTVWDKDLEPDIRKLQVRIAREVLAAEQAKGFDPKPRRIVDRRYDAPLEAVKPFGVIEFVARGDVLAVARWIYQQLKAKSPVLTGRYRSSHIIMVNEAALRGTLDELRDFRPGDRIQIVNTQPYARKIEGRGKSFRGGMLPALSKQAPNGVYRSVYAAARRRFGKVAFIDFTYRKLDLGVTAWGYQGGGWARKDGASTQHRRKRIRRPLVYPVIKIFQSRSAMMGSPE